MGDPGGGGEGGLNKKQCETNEDTAWRSLRELLEIHLMRLLNSSLGISMFPSGNNTPGYEI
jgi:hypothetical protein